VSVVGVVVARTVRRGGCLAIVIPDLLLDLGCELTGYAIKLVFEQSYVVTDRLVYRACAASRGEDRGEYQTRRQYLCFLCAPRSTAHLPQTFASAPLPAVLGFLFARQALYRHRTGAAMKIEL